MPNDALKQLVAQLIDGHVNDFGGHADESGDPLVDQGAAVLDQPVGVEQERFPGLQSGFVVSAPVARFRAEEDLRPGVQHRHAPKL
ncbi:hypothetical protein SAMN05216574_107115 [Blastococcus tunisiensis]|uniref:Uncharacterized protein n=1 Tax=Blastococcus tunisiensis TaxID=1798228 RepID=A0A1I2ELQ7_9ACTN|nr:hypothetical protein SAMN05216574_107115 [Blastococcus sp. DSM 46838]